MSELAKDVVRWKKVNAGCDHKKHSERVDDMQMCKCAKLSNVICTSRGIAADEFSDAVGQHTAQNIDPKEWQRTFEAVKAVLAKEQEGELCVKNN